MQIVSQMSKVLVHLEETETENRRMCIIDVAYIRNMTHSSGQQIRAITKQKTLVNECRLICKELK